MMKKFGCCGDAEESVGELGPTKCEARLPEVLLFRKQGKE